MSRLIDADALLEILQSWRDEAERLNAPVNYKFASAIIAQVERMPTIEERKKGKWVIVTDRNGQHAVCDQCGEWRYHQGQKFCGECGADMRGPEDIPMEYFESGGR